MAQDWDEETQAKFRQVLDKMPVFVRSMAEKAVGTKAEANAASAGNAHVTEKDLIDAFFSETPFGFHGPMMTDLEAVGLDYKKYGHPIDHTGGMFRK